MQDNRPPLLLQHMCALYISEGGTERAQLILQAGWSRAITVAAHALMGALLLWRARQTDLTQSADVYSCYMFVWKLFYAEYLIIPFLR